jgi:hypothetical protein
MSLSECRASDRLGFRSLNQKKADVLKHPRVFQHVGILTIEPPGHGPNSTSRVALYLVIRRVQLIIRRSGH